MDRGVRIAIIAACFLSLGLGLIWDSVIEATRSMVVEQSESNDMGPDPAVLSVGDTKLPAPQRDLSDLPETSVENQIGDSGTPQEWFDPADESSASSTTLGGSATQATGPQPKVSYDSAATPFISGGQYEVQSGDSWWKIAHKRFVKYRDAMVEAGHWSDSSIAQEKWKSANASLFQQRGENLRVGDKLNIPQ